MSFGSRATQAKPEALSSCSEQLPETASFLRVTAGLSPRAPDFLALRKEISFGVLRATPRTGAQTVLNLPCDGE
jgi:hypothetical protein